MISAHKAFKTRSRRQGRRLTLFLSPTGFLGGRHFGPGPRPDVVDAYQGEEVCVAVLKRGAVGGAVGVAHPEDSTFIWRGALKFCAIFLPPDTCKSGRRERGGRGGRGASHYFRQILFLLFKREKSCEAAK